MGVDSILYSFFVYLLFIILFICLFIFLFLHSVCTVLSSCFSPLFSLALNKIEPQFCHASKLLWHKEKSFE